jgi:hypothetical protein
MLFPGARCFEAGNNDRERIRASVGLGARLGRASGAVDEAFERPSADQADAPARCALTNDVLAGRVSADHKPIATALNHVWRAFGLWV